VNQERGGETRRENAGYPSRRPLPSSHKEGRGPGKRRKEGHVPGGLGSKSALPVPLLCVCHPKTIGPPGRSLRSQKIMTKGEKKEGNHQTRSSIGSPLLCWKAPFVRREKERGRKKGSPIRKKAIPYKNTYIPLRHHSVLCEVSWSSARVRIKEVFLRGEVEQISPVGRSVRAKEDGTGGGRVKKAWKREEETATKILRTRMASTRWGERGKKTGD